MTKTLVLTSSHISLMKKHVVKNRPKEACGIIIGEIDILKGKYTATEVFLTENIIKSDVEFEIDPYKLYEIYMYADKIGKEVISIFHSHPMGTTPSLTDIDFMRVNPYIWLIFDMHSLEYTAYFLDISKDRLTKVKVVIKD